MPASQSVAASLGQAKHSLSRVRGVMSRHSVQAGEPATAVNKQHSIVETIAGTVTDGDCHQEGQCGDTMGDQSGAPMGPAEPVEETPFCYPCAPLEA